MRDIGDMDLEVPAAVGAMLDVDGVVEIARVETNKRGPGMYPPSIAILMPTSP